MIAERNPKLSKVNIRNVMDELLAVIQEETTKGNEIALVGFGSFKLKHKAAREARNPKTGEAIKIAESTQVVAKLSSTWAKLK